MINYDEGPCSLFVPNKRAPLPTQQLNIQSNRPVPPEPERDLERQPIVANQIEIVEEVEEQPRFNSTRTAVNSKKSEEATFVEKKKSCLTKNVNKPIPEHPALKKKTVAFGKTVNVSQTVEGTSRKSKKVASTFDRNTKKTMSNKSPPRAEEFGEETEDLRTTMEEKMNQIKDELMEENKKIQMKNLSEMKNSIAEIMQKMLSEAMVNNKNSNIDEKENSGSFTRQERERTPMLAQPNVNKTSIAYHLFKKEGRLNMDAVEIIERRIRSNPIFRQQVDDVLAEAEYESNRGIYSPMTTSSRYRPDALMKETLTVERSIRVDKDNAMNAWSVDSRHFMNSAGNSPYTPMNDRGRFQNDIQELPLHSTYQPGNSISYYPSELEGKNRKNNDYYVEHFSDHEDHPDETKAHFGNESRAERERRIREKYTKRH